MSKDILEKPGAVVPPAPQEPDDDLLPEYDFDYSKAKPNLYAGKITARSRSVTLAPDVAAVFGNSDAVNDALRALISAARAHVPAEPAA